MAKQSRQVSDDLSDDEAPEAVSFGTSKKAAKGEEDAATRPDGMHGGQDQDEEVDARTPRPARPHEDSLRTRCIVGTSREPRVSFHRDRRRHETPPQLSERNRANYGRQWR